MKKSHVFSINDIALLVTYIQKGDVLAYPTESVWGLGCDPFNETAVNKILALKTRAVDKGVILVFGNETQVLPYIAHLEEVVQKKMLKVWQQSLSIRQATTFVVPFISKNQTMAKKIPVWLSGKYQSIAIRISPHESLQQLCLALNSPIVSTSCNPATLDPALTMAQAKAYFHDNVHYLNEKTLGFEKPSHILDALSSDILR